MGVVAVCASVAALAVDVDGLAADDDGRLAGTWDRAGPPDCSAGAASDSPIGRAPLIASSVSDAVLAIQRLRALRRERRAGVGGQRTSSVLSVNLDGGVSSATHHLCQIAL